MESLRSELGVSIELSLHRVSRYFPEQVAASILHAAGCETLMCVYIRETGYVHSSVMLRVGRCVYV